MARRDDDISAAGPDRSMPDDGIEGALPSMSIDLGMTLSVFSTGHRGKLPTRGYAGSLRRIHPDGSGFGTWPTEQ